MHHGGLFGRQFRISVGDESRGIADGDNLAAFVDLVDRRRPDVIGVSGPKDQ
jgi:transcription elongation factor SPT6